VVGGGVCSVCWQGEINSFKVLTVYFLLVLSLSIHCELCVCVCVCTEYTHTRHDGCAGRLDSQPANATVHIIIIIISNGYINSA
jgi:hypothetical protein